MNIKHFVKKAGLFLFVLLQTVFLNVPTAWSFGETSDGTLLALFGGSPKVKVGKNLRKAEQRYNVDPNAVRDMAEGFNVSGAKKFAPEVKILFSPQDPKPGQKVTARAFSMYYSTQPSQQYYTWYLKRGRCYDQVTGTVENAGSCDRDGDGDVDINDYKIEAARILAGNGFDTRTVEPGGREDDDGYIAFPGGDNSRSVRRDENGNILLNPYYYYIHDFATGKSYEIVRQINDSDMFGCNEDEVAVCLENNADLSCPADIYVEGGQGGEGGAGGGGGADDGSGGAGGAGGQGGEGGSVSSQVSYTFNICGSTATSPTCPQPDSFALFRATTPTVPRCPGDAFPACVNRQAFYTYDIDGGDNPDNYLFMDVNGQPQPIDFTQVYRQPGIFWDYTCNDRDIRELIVDGQVPEQSLSCSINRKRDPITGEVVDNIDYRLIDTCTPQNRTDEGYDRFHLFPRNADGEQVGGPDGEFGFEDEIFFGTDPYDDDTADNRVKDEATVVGLGQDTFSWIYSPGDQIGVIVEGESMMATKHPDSSKMIMFATVNNACDLSGIMNETVLPVDIGSYTASIRGRNVKIPAVSYGDENDSFEEVINNCLNNSENAFIDPARGGAAKKLNISLSYSPTNPIYDPVGTVVAGEQTSVSVGDKLVVRASVTNADYDDDRLSFKWSVYRSNNLTADFDPENWTRIRSRTEGVDPDNPDELFLEDFFADVTPLTGNDLGSLELRLTPPDAEERNELFTDENGEVRDTTYLKFRVEVEENFDLLSSELYRYDVSRGRGEVIVRLARSSDTIKVYTVTSREQITTPGDVSGMPICADTPGQVAVCPVVKNQLLKLAVDERQEGGGLSEYGDRAGAGGGYTWLLDGKPMYCNEKVFTGECDGTNEGVYNYLAVLGDVGTRYTVTVVATNVGGNGGKSVELTRVFEVVEPYLAPCESGFPSETGGSTEILVGCNNLTRKVKGMFLREPGVDTENQNSDVDGDGINDFVPDISENVFRSVAGGSFTIAASVRPRWIADQTTIDWFANNVLVSAGSNSATVDTSDKNPGENINIRAQAVYIQPTDVREILREAWNVTDNEMSDKRFDANIQVQLVASADDLQSMTPPQVFMAALGLNAPGTVVFVFRVFLVVAALVFFIGILWYFLPDRISRRKQ